MAFNRFVDRLGPSPTLEQIEVRFLAVERAALRSLRESAPAATGQQFEVVELVIAAMFALMCAIQESGGLSLAEHGGFLVSLDDRIELFNRYIALFYERFYRTAAIHPRVS